MAELRLNLAAYRYEHTAALFDGRVTIEGVDAAWHTSPLVFDIFFEMTRGGYDVAEYGLSYFLRMWDTEESPFLALPIFPNRNFRHSAVFVNAHSGIEKPEDLTGRTIGEFALYGHDAGVWPKGILAEEYGFRPRDCRWIIADGSTDLRIAHLAVRDMPGSGTGDGLLAWAGIDAQHITGAAKRLLADS